MKLTAKSAEAAVRAGSRKRYPDGNGLVLSVRPGGGASWQYRIRMPRESIVTYGTYPAMSLAEARKRHVEARSKVSQGINPNVQKAQAKLQQSFDAVHSFESVALKWLEKHKNEVAPSYFKKVVRRLEADVFPFIGKRPIASLKRADIYEVAQRIQARGVFETAYRAVHNCNGVFNFAVNAGLIDANPCGAVAGALKKGKTSHMPGFTKPDDLAKFLRLAYEYKGTYVVRAALKLTPMLMLRPGELRSGRWEEVDLENALWTIPASRMKNIKEKKASGPPHLVPLPSQAVEVLRELRQLTGPTGYMFRGEQNHDRPMSENSVNAAIRRIGYDTQEEICAHGFRSTARTMLEEVPELNFPAQVIEAQLAHEVRDSLGRAYNRTTHDEQRRKMLQAWADFLDHLRQDTPRLRLVAEPLSLLAA